MCYDNGCFVRVNKLIAELIIKATYTKIAAQKFVTVSEFLINFSAVTANLVKQKALLLVPTLLRGEEIYTQMGFFVQSILADRYNRREL